MAERPAMLQDTSMAYLNKGLLDKHVDTMSMPTLWEKSYLCPCRDRRTRQPDQACPLCYGRGVAFLPSKDLKVIIQSQEKGVFNGDLGILDSGTAIGTPDSAVRVSFRDRITVKDAVVSQSTIFDASQRRIDKGHYLVYDVREIEYATTMEGELVEGEDYEFDFNKNMFYPKQHLLSKNISLNISTTLRYMVADLLKEHRYARKQDETRSTLQQKLLLKREDIFIDKEAFELGTEQESIDDMIDTKRTPNPEGINGFFKRG